MAHLFSIDRRSPRTPLDVQVRIERRDGSVIAGQCIDTSDEGFGISAGVTLNIGEIVRLTVLAPTAYQPFIARVMWQEGSRIGFYCVGLKPMLRDRDATLQNTADAAEHRSGHAQLPGVR